jgi:hypothetical protein
LGFSQEKASRAKSPRKHLNKEIKVSKTNQSKMLGLIFIWSLRNNLKGGFFPPPCYKADEASLTLGRKSKINLIYLVFFFLESTKCSSKQNYLKGGDYIGMVIV